MILHNLFCTMSGKTVLACPDSWMMTISFNSFWPFLSTFAPGNKRKLNSQGNSNLTTFPLSFFYALKQRIKPYTSLQASLYLCIVTFEGKFNNEYTFWWKQNIPCGVDFSGWLGSDASITFIQNKKYYYNTETKIVDICLSIVSKSQLSDIQYIL